ncbi:MAG: hypothetical protein AMXMBFR33_58550 [Candidatus Xenobia bacterium]
MRRLLLLLILLWGVSGCSSSENVALGNAPVNPVPPQPGGVPIQVTPQRASAVASGLVSFGAVEAILPDSTLGITARAGEAGSLPQLSASSPNSASMALALSVLANGVGTVESPLGGSLVITRGPANALVARCNALRTVQGTLNGELQAVVTTGSLETGNYSASLSFQALSFETPDVTWTFNGPADLEVSRAGNTFGVTWDSSMTVSDLLKGRSVTYDDFVITNEMALGGANASCTSTYNGSLSLSNVNGLSGDVSVLTTVPFTFSGNLANNAADLQLSAGQLSINAGGLVVTVARTNVVTLAVAGNVVREVAWAYLGGPARLTFALRPTVADTILQNGNFLTLDPANSRAQALAVMDGRILAIGPNAAVNRFQGPVTEVVSLAGNTCLPGFIEPHMHLNLTALTLMANVNPQVVSCGNEGLNNTIQSALDGLTQALQAAPDAEAIYGFGFDPSRLVPAELMQNLTLDQLDAISTTVPIVVQNASQHISYVNSAAFRVTGTWPTAPNPPYTPPPDIGQFIVVDPNTGLPTGQINETAQNIFIQAALQGITNTVEAKIQYLEQFEVLMDVLAAQGITTASDQLTGSALGINGELDVFGLLELDPSNPVRIRCYIDAFLMDDTLNVFAGEGYDKLRVIGAKFITDGSTQGLTAGLNFNYIFPGPFPVAPNGLLDFASDMALLSLAQPIYDQGFQICFHTNGDRAQDQVFSVVRMLRANNPRPDPRTRIEHFTVHQTSELAEHVATARELELEISHTIGHVFFWGKVLNDTLLGADVARHIDPVRSLLDAGVNVSTHSDSPVSSPNPLRNIQTLTTRLWQVPPQQVLGPDEIISVEDAIDTVTINAARMMFLDRQVGTLEVGKLADLVILDQDPTAVAPTQITSINVLGTYLAGQQVFQAP